MGRASDGAIKPTIWLSGPCGVLVFCGEFCFTGNVQSNGGVAKWPGTALQKRLQQFESARHLQIPVREIVKTKLSTENQKPKDSTGCEARIS